MTGRVPQRGRLRGRLKGVAGWMPGALTLGNLLAGYSAILLASRSQFLLAVGLIFAAAVFDGLDGRVARLTGTTSDFGEELDSLADAVSFAVAPSVIAFHLALAGLGRIGWAACFLYAACGVIRLARFNASTSERHDFIGVPSPTAAATVTCPVLLTDGGPLPEGLAPFYAILVAVIGLLMVSRLRYISPKAIRFGTKPYRGLAVWAAVLAGLVMKYEWVIPGLIALYLLSPLYRSALRRWIREVPVDVADDEGTVQAGPPPGRDAL